MDGVWGMRERGERMTQAYDLSTWENGGDIS